MKLVLDVAMAVRMNLVKLYCTEQDEEDAGPCGARIVEYDDGEYGSCEKGHHQYVRNVFSGYEDVGLGVTS